MNMEKLMHQHTHAARLALVGIIFVSTLIIAPVGAEEAESINALRQIGKAFASIAEKASPAVVGVEATKVIKRSRRPQFQRPNMPFNDDMFEYFFGPRGNRQGDREERAQGTGFIISKDGYILTNNHIVGDAKDDKVTVRLSDTKKYEAEVIGADAGSDVAVIKIETDEDLPFIELADSDQLEVGEWVIAIGSPFGLNHSVTAGIVSAKGRNSLYALGNIDFQDFIQTDAAINPGNSGGPLLNLDCKVVGINTAILAPSGANAGIGFAIPVNLARDVSKQLIDSGEVVRGFLGISMEPLSEAVAESLELEDSRGALVVTVGEGTPAQEAGLKRYDVIVELNGEPIENQSELMSKIAALKPETKVKMVVIRDGRRKKLTATLGERSDTALAKIGGRPDETETRLDLGIGVTNLTDTNAERYGYTDKKGVLIEQIETGSKAQRQGLEPGMLIMEVNRKAVSNTRDFYAAIERAVEQEKKSVLLYVTDGSRESMIALELSDD